MFSGARRVDLCLLVPQALKPVLMTCGRCSLMSSRDRMVREAINFYYSFFWLAVTHFYSFCGQRRFGAVTR